MQLAEQKMQEQANQHQKTLQEQKQYILNLEKLMTAEVDSHRKANDALQQAIEDKATLKGEVKELSQQLGSALEQIQKLTEDLASTRSLLDVQVQDRKAANAGASTSAPEPEKLRRPTQDKGKRPPAGQTLLWGVPEVNR